MIAIVVQPLSNSVWALGDVLKVLRFLHYLKREFLQIANG
jgi:hypothetical protein